ncbi:MAG: dihydroorotate dehydrogenase (quinone) [SAR202 cluster bacterium]|nr:dihydroorotate dehydrogenase (quinone) [SAR202 cluster bacterium]|tara:strand:+ start:1588 stop:2643 length:1056 start_codon:yes stop_codon:yes gene_type:complete
MYENLLRPILFKLPPEKAQSFADFFLKRKLIWEVYHSFQKTSDPRLQISYTNDQNLPSPLGFAAGYDKDCEFLTSLLLLGFGYVIGGTIVNSPRYGNEKPRIARNIKEEALINALGFPSKGKSYVTDFLEKYQKDLSKRQNLGKIMLSISGLDHEDLLSCHSDIQPYASFLEINISSPNTSNIKIFQEQDNLAKLLNSLNKQKSLFLKLPPYTTNEEKTLVFSLIKTAISCGIDGFTIANTKPISDDRLAVGKGGMSGKPLLTQTIQMVKEIRSEFGFDFIINACGGISNAYDLLSVLYAGANTGQLLTAFIYRGPNIANNINNTLVKLIEKTGSKNITELVQQYSNLDKL